MILGIQQENRHIRQLQHENKELRAALEEHQNAIELIMSKYRQHITCLVHSSKPDKNAINQQKTRVSYLYLEAQFFETPAKDKSITPQFN